MPSLASVTSESRLILKIIVAIAGGAFLIFLVIQAAFFTKNLLFPDPVPLPEEKFGKLPKISFPPQTEQVSYRINTVDGNLPNVFPDRIEVYKIQAFTPSLTAVDNARAAARAVKFTLSETPLSDTEYKWTNENGKTLVYNIYTKNFKIDSNFTAFPINYPVGSLQLNKNQIITTISDFLGTIGADTSDINFDVSSIRYYRISGGELFQVSSQSEAQIARIDLFQVAPGETIKTLPHIPTIMYPFYNGSPIHFFVGEYRGSLDIVKGEFYHDVVDIQTFSTYPIITPQEAFEKLSQGEGFLVYEEDDILSKTLDVTDVALAYYLGEKDNKYIQPIYVFVGSNFYAYVPAIPDTSIGN